MDETTRLQALEVMGIESWQTKISAEKMSSIVNTEHKQTSPPSTTTTIPRQSNHWELLVEAVSHCQKCALYKTRTQTVFGMGNPNADWLFIGEAPGENEDLQGQPFVGYAGLLLTEMIRALGLNREQVFITNILKCRPPNNRDPDTNEISSCHDYLRQQQILIQPKIIIAVGRIAAQKLLNTQESLAKLRGQVHQLDAVPLIVIYHPAYLLRSLSQKRAAWQDLQLALKTYQALPAS
jgi:DNA polymerase